MYDIMHLQQQLQKFARCSLECHLRGERFKKGRGEKLTLTTAIWI